MANKTPLITAAMLGVTTALEGKKESKNKPDAKAENKEKTDTKSAKTENESNANAKSDKGVIGNFIDELRTMRDNSKARENGASKEEAPTFPKGSSIDRAAQARLSPEKYEEMQGGGTPTRTVSDDELEYLRKQSYKTSDVLTLGMGPIRADGEIGGYTPRQLLQMDNQNRGISMEERRAESNKLLILNSVNGYHRAAKKGASAEELEEMKGIVTDKIEKYKAKYPELYEKEKEDFDTTVKNLLPYYADATEETRAFLRDVEAYHTRAAQGASAENTAKAKQAAKNRLDNIKTRYPEYYAENAAYFVTMYTGTISSEEAKKHIDNNEKEFTIFGDELKITWQEIYSNAVVRETERSAKKALDFEETVKRGWGFGSSEAMEKSGIQVRGSYTLEQDTDMQRFGNPLIYLTEPERLLSGTQMEIDYDADYKQTEADYFGRQMFGKEGFFEGLLPNGVTYSDKHNLVLQMTDDEKDIFTYLYMKDIDNGITEYSNSNAKKYFDNLVPTLNKRLTGDVTGQMKELSLGGGLALRVFNNLAAAGAATRVAAKQLSGEEVDENDQLFLPTNMNNAMQEEWFKDLNDTQSFFAGMGLSIFDNVTTRAITGKTKLSTILMPAQVFTSTAQQSASDNLSNGASFGLSTVLALTEGLTEEIKFAFFDEAADSAKLAFIHNKGVSKKALAGLKALGIEGLTGSIEETTNEVVAITAEMIFSGDNARIRKYYNEYVEEHGEQKTRAVFSVALSLAKDLSSVAASGFLSEAIMGSSQVVGDISTANKMVKSAEKDGYTSDIGRAFNDPENVQKILNKAKKSDNDIVKALAGDLSNKLNNLNESKEIANSIGNEGHQLGILDSTDEQQMYDLGLLARAVDSEAANSVYEQLSKNNSSSDIATTAESAIEAAMGEVAKANSGATTTDSGDTKRIVPLDDKKPKVNVRTEDGDTVTVNGERYGKVQGRTVYTVKGNDFGAADAYYAIDSTTGLALASGETKSIIHEQMKAVKASGKTTESAVFEDGSENVFAGEVDVPIDFDSLERAVPLKNPTKVDTATTPDATATSDTASAPKATESGYVPMRRIDAAEATKSESKAPEGESRTVDTDAYKRAFTERKTTAVADGTLSGDDLDVGKTVTHSDLTQTVLNMALESGKTELIRAAKDIRSRTYKNTAEMYRAIGGLAKAVGVTGEDIIQSRAASIAQRYENSNFGSGYENFSNDLRQKFELAGDEVGIQALDYLDSMYEKSGMSGIETVATDGIEYSESNRNIAAENYVSGLQYAFRANGNKTTKFEVYYDSSEGAKRGEWKVDGKDNVTIRINGAKVRGAESAAWVLSHELFHSAAKNNPGIVNRVLETFEKIGIYDSSKFEAYKEAYRSEYEAAYKGRLDSGEITQEQYDELVNNYVREEIAADLMQDVMGNEELANMFAQNSTKEDLNFIARFFRKFIDAIKKVFGGNKKHQQYVYDAEKLLGVFERAVKNYGNKKASGGAQTRNAASNQYYNYADNDFAKQIDDYLNPNSKLRKKPPNDSFLIGGTPRVLRDIGFNALPMTINKTHIDYALNGTKDFDHEVFVDVLKKIPAALENPVMVMESDSVNGRAVVVLKITAKNGKKLYLPVEIDGTAKLNGISLDSNAIASALGKNNVETKIKDALNSEAQGNTSVFYWNKKEAISLLHRGGLQLPTSLPQDGFVHSIREKGSNVKVKLQDVTQSLQFKRWFGDWQNNPKKASKVVNADGTPRVVYHQTDADFNIFDVKHNGAGTSDSDTPFGIFLKPTDKDIGLNGKKQMALYAVIKNPLEATDREQLIYKLKNISQEYADICQEIDKMNRDYSDKESAADKALSDYLVEWRSKNPDASRTAIYEDARYNELSDKQDRIIEEWESADAELSKRAKEILTDALKKAGYDGVHLKNDAGSFERETETFIALEPTQIKSATDNIGTFDKSNPDIRYAVSAPSAKENSVFSPEQRKKIIPMLTKLAGSQGIARLSKNEFVTDVMNILEKTLDTGIVSDKVYEDIARTIYEYAREDAGDASVAGTYIDIKKRLYKMGKIYVSEAVKNDIPDYNDFRKQFGTLLTTKEDASYLSVDEVFADLKADYPDVFSEDLNLGDQLQKIAEVLETARKYEKDNGLVSVSELYTFDKVKNDYLEMADDIVEGISALSGIELVDETEVYETLRDKDESVSATELPDELYITKGMTDEQVDAVLEKVRATSSKNSPEYKFIKRLFEAERNVENAKKNLRSVEKLAKTKGFEADSKRVVDFTKALANEFGFGSDVAKTADVGRELKQVFDSASAYLKEGDDNSLNSLVASIGEAAEKIAGYSSGEVDAVKLGGYILGNIMNVAKGKTGAVKVSDTESIMQSKSSTWDELERIQGIAEKNINKDVSSAKDDLRKATAKLRAQQMQPFFETVMDKFFDMREAEIAKADTRFAEQLAEEKAKGKEAVKNAKESERAKADDRVVGEKMGYEREAAEARRKSEEQLAEERAKRRESVAEERRKSKERIEELREHNREVRERKSERRNRRKQEEKLLRVINRLRKVKTDSETQEIISNVIGDLDYLGISIRDDHRIGLERLRERYDEKAKDPDFIREPGTERMLSRLDNRQIHELSADELAHILEMAKALEHQIAFDKSVVIHEKAVSKYRAARAGINGVLDTKGAKYDKAVPGLWNKYSTSLRSPQRFFKKIFGYDKSNEMYLLTEEINNGQRKSLMIQQESERPFEGLVRDKEIEKFTGKKAVEYDTGITTISGKKLKITPAQKVALYLSSKNHDFLRHAAGGGIKFPDIKLLKDGKVKEAYAKGQTVSLTPSEIRNITSGLTEYEKKWADATENYFNEVSRKYINEASLEMYGYEIANVENYFPIMTNSNFNAKEPESLVRNATLEGKGFLKERVQSTNQVLLEDVTSVLQRHIKDVADFSGLSAPIKNFSKAYTATVNFADGSRMSVREAIEQKWGPAATKYIDNLLSDLQTPRKAERGLAEKLRSKRAAAIMIMNVPVTLGNFANYFHASTTLGGSSLVKGLFGGKVDTELVAKYTPYLQSRMEGYTTKEFGDIAKGDSSGTKKSIGQKIVNMMQFVDILCTKATWNASRAYVDSKFGDLKKGSDEYYRTVAQIFNKTIEDTQVNDLVYQKADILKSTNFFVNEITMFKSELLKNLDMIRDAGGEYAATVRKYGGLKNTLREAKRGNEEVREVLTHTRRVMVSQAAAMAFVQVVDALVKGVWFEKWSYKDEEEDEVTKDSLVEEGVQNFIMGLFAMFPGAEDAINLTGNIAKGVAGLFDVELPMDFKWYGMNANVFEMINSFADGATGIIDSVGKYQKGEASHKSIINSTWDFLSENVAPFLGIPSENLENLFKSTYLKVIEKSGGEYYGKYLRYKADEDGAAYYTRQKMITQAYKAKEAGDMEAYNAIREDMIKSRFASAATFDKGIKNLETAIELGTYGDVFKKAVEYDEKAGNTYERDGSGEAAFRYEVAHHDRYFAENAVELVKDLPKNKQDEALSLAAELIRASDHKKTRGQQLAIDNFNSVGDEGIFKFSAEGNDMSKTVDGEKETADFEFDDYISYVEEYRDATEFLRLAIFGTDKDVADYGKEITGKYAGEAWLMYANGAPDDNASDREKADYYIKAVKEVQYAILDKYKTKYFEDYGDAYEAFGDIASGKNVASDLYLWEKSGENAYSKEIYSKADDLIGKAQELVDGLPEGERDAAMRLVTDYAEGFAYTERKGGMLLAEAYDRVYGGVEAPELKADSVFDMYSEYSNISKTVDGKKYKSDFTVGDYIEYNKEIADADELVRLALFGGKGSAEAKELKAKYKNEPWMKLVEAAEGKSGMSDKEKLELYTDIRNDITSNIKLPYEHKYIKATSSGNADIDNFFVERDAAYSALDYSKDDNGDFTDGDSKGKYNYYSRTNSFVNNSLELIDNNPLLSPAQRKEQKDKLGEYVRGLRYSPTLGQKYIMAEFDDYQKSAEEYNKYIDAEISRTGDNTLDKMHWDSAESKTTSKSKDSIPYTVTYSQPQYAEMVGHMDRGEEYAALYIFGTDKELREYKATLTAAEKAWVNEGVSELNKEAKKIDKYIAKGILSKESRDAYLYYALVGKIKSAVRASYREDVFGKYRKDADTPKGYYVKYNP